MTFHVLLKHGLNRLGDQTVQNLAFRHLVRAHQVQFQFAEGRGVQMAQVTDTRNRRVLSESNSSLSRTGNHRAKVCDCQSSTHSRLLIDVLRLASFDRNLLDNFQHEVWNFHGVRPLEIQA